LRDRKNITDGAEWRRWKWKVVTEVSNDLRDLEGVKITRFSAALYLCSPQKKRMEVKKTM
jgi:hypothetical protein